MTEDTDEDRGDRRVMRLLALILTIIWAVTALVIATAFRPGGPVDIIVALACFVPVVIADAGVVWPAQGLRPGHRAALVWVWIGAVLFVLPVLYDLAETLVSNGPRVLVPSFESAYGAFIALYLMSFFSLVGAVHRRRRVRPLERRASWASAGLALVLTFGAGLSFLFVAAVNDQDLRAEEPPTSRFGPTDPDLLPPSCDQPPELGPNARIVMEASSSIDADPRGSARLQGRRSGTDEAWGASWNRPEGRGAEAYLRIGDQAWVNPTSADVQAPGTSWLRVAPDPFGLLGDTTLTMDGPVVAHVDAPRGEIVVEDLGLEVIEGARARHCRTFIDGDTALRLFLPLRWLLTGESSDPGAAIPRWRGQLDWWVFADGQLGRASVQVSGSRADTDWVAQGARVLLEATLTATDRTRAVDLTAPSGVVATIAPGPPADSPPPGSSGPPGSPPPGSSGPSAGSGPQVGSGPPVGSGPSAGSAAQASSEPAASSGPPVGGAAQASSEPAASDAPSSTPIAIVFSGESPAPPTARSAPLPLQSQVP